MASTRSYVGFFYGFFLLLSPPGRGKVGKFRGVVARLAGVPSSRLASLPRALTSLARPLPTSEEHMFLKRPRLDPLATICLFIYIDTHIHIYVCVAIYIMYIYHIYIKSLKVNMTLNFK